MMVAMEVAPGSSGHLVTSSLWHFKKGKDISTRGTEHSTQRNRRLDGAAAGPLAP